VQDFRNPFYRQKPAFSYSAAAVSLALDGDGQANPSGWYPCRCPAHDDQRFSLSVRDTSFGVIVHCFTGCRPVEVKAAILEVMHNPHRIVRQTPPPRPRLTSAELERIVRSLRDECAPSPLVERYLRSRGITIELPPTLMGHVALYHMETRSCGLAMVASLQAADGTLVSAIHRTWLAADGSGKAKLAPARKSLGSIMNHSVHLGQPSSRLIVGEGIETTISALQLWGSSFDAWAALSASNLAALIVPDAIEEIIVAADNDDAGRRAALQLRSRLLRENPTRRVSWFIPSNGRKDFNDALQAREV
jgi:hypothetical protein